CEKFGSGSHLAELDKRRNIYTAPIFNSTLNNTNNKPGNPFHYPLKLMLLSSTTTDQGSSGKRAEQQLQQQQRGVQVTSIPCIVKVICEPSSQPDD
uniref:Uncharacterized protein n=1 Tax=Glossina palpalis gambiensis TaxID=67801 RepID=A0A1B0BE49_9MUSC